MRSDIMKKIKNTNPTNSISVGVSWIDGRTVLKPEKRRGDAYFGVCHFTDKIWAITPLDWDKATMITTIHVSPLDHFCERSGMCLNFKCKLNSFNRNIFTSYFEDCGAFTLGLPSDLGTKDLWFNEGKWGAFWGKLLRNFNMKPEGGVLKYNEKTDKLVM